MQTSFTKRKILYIYVTLAMISILLGLVSYARAQEPAQDRGMSETRMNRGMERRVTLTEEQQNRFINLVRNVHARMDAAIGRLENITGRLETRIAKLEAQGVDTSRALQPLNDAKNKLAEARAVLDTAKADAEDGIISDTPREAFKPAREQFATIRQSIRDAYILVRESVTALKDAVRESELNQNGVNAAVQSETPERDDEAETN